MSRSIRIAATTAALALIVGAGGPQAGAAETPAQRSAGYSALGQLPDWDRGVWQIDCSPRAGDLSRPP
jgi:hypothetical protein